MQKLFNNLLLNKYFSNVSKIVTLFAFIGLIIIGFSAHSEDPKFLKELRNFNLANLIVWSYWWPIIIVSAIFFGRVWCMVCPVELITSIFSKIGMKKKRSKFVKSGW